MNQQSCMLEFCAVLRPVGHGDVGEGGGARVEFGEGRCTVVVSKYSMPVNINATILAHI